MPLSEVPALLISKPICLGLRCSSQGELGVPIWKVGKSEDS